MRPSLKRCRATLLPRRVPIHLLAVASAGLLVAACGSSSPSASSPTTSGGTSSRSTASTQGTSSSGAWSAPVKVDTLDKQGLTAVSCVSSTFCVAIDSLGNAFVYSSGTWSSGTNIDAAVTGGGTLGDQLSTISCASSTFCVAGDTKYNVMVYNGTSWTQPQSVDPKSGSQFFSVSCPSATFCLVVDGASDSTTYNGSTWSPAQGVPNGWGPAESGGPNGSVLSSRLTQVSCATPASCVAVDGSDHSITYTGTSWGQPQYVDAGGSLQGPLVPYVACASTTFCIGAGSINATSEYLVTYDGSSWSKPLPSDSSPNEYHAVTCASGPFCMVLEAAGNTVSYNGMSWSHAQHVEPLTSAGQANALSCASASFCVAVDNLGYALVSKP